MGSDGEGRSKDGNAGEAEKGARVEARAVAGLETGVL